jgi:LPXTG-motif cell wall-anchored protein
VPAIPDVSTTPDTPVNPDVPAIPAAPATPDTPVPDVAPTPNENPTIPDIIIDDNTPLAQEVAQVLGARRASADQAMVLGARRGRTGDSTSNPLMATLMIMGASASALGLLSSKKKRK